MPKAVFVANKTGRPFCKLGWSASCVSYSHVLTRQPVAPSQAREGRFARAKGSSMEASPHPLHSQRCHCPLALRSPVWRPELVFLGRKVRRLAWLVAHLRISLGCLPDCFFLTISLFLRDRHSGFRTRDCGRLYRVMALCFCRIVSGDRSCCWTFLSLARVHSITLEST